MTLTLDPPRVRAGSLEPVWEKVRSGQRLNAADGNALFAAGPRHLLEIGQMADWVARQRHGDRVQFVVNRQINPTNLCVLDCKFCEFAKRKGDPDGYAMAIPEVLAHCSPDLHEVHLVGGLHPSWPFEAYLEIVQAIHDAYPKLPIKAWTAVEIDWFARLSHSSYSDVLERLRGAGLVALPGGGAEVFSERVRAELFPHKIGEREWMGVHRAAHEMGLPSNATLLYGHIETFAERVDHMIKLRTLQDEAPGFFAFIPLTFQPGGTGITARMTPPTDDLVTVAVSRLMLDNFPHIKAYWAYMGAETAAVALNFGADDVDGTIGFERIGHAAKAASPVGLATQALIDVIRSAGKIPVERDALYNVVRVHA